MIFVLENHEVDTEKREIRGAGGPVHVEPRVLDTLIYLLENRERVIARQELVERVWSVGHVTDSAVTRSVMAARRALGDNGSQSRMIRTFYGRGYRFVAAVETADATRIASSPQSAASTPQRRSPSRSGTHRFVWPVAATLLLGLLASTTLMQSAPADAQQEVPGLHLCASGASRCQACAFAPGEARRC